MSGYYAYLHGASGKAEVTPVALKTPTFARPDSEVSSSTVTINVTSSSGNQLDEQNLSINYGTQK